MIGIMAKTRHHDDWWQLREKGNYMSRLIMCVALALFITPETASAQDYDAAMKSYDAGDYTRAFLDFSQLADQGDPRAQYQMGVMYLEGYVAPLDRGIAAGFFKLAAAQDFATAKTMLGYMYADGIGGKRDLISAYMWLDMGGDYSKMLEVAAEMSPADISEAERRGIACRKSKYQDCD